MSRHSAVDLTQDDASPRPSVASAAAAAAASGSAAGVTRAAAPVAAPQQALWVALRAAVNQKSRLLHRVEFQGMGDKWKLGSTRIKELEKQRQLDKALSDLKQSEMTVQNLFRKVESLDRAKQDMRKRLRIAEAETAFKR